jgi:hypothetical protein
MDVVWRMERPPSVGKALRKIGFYHTEKEKGHREVWDTCTIKVSETKKKHSMCSSLHVFSAQSKIIASERFQLELPFKTALRT